MGDPESGEGFDEQVGRIAALAEPIRLALFRYVTAEREPVGREQAASAVGVAPHTAKFHLDRLESGGLLESEYSRPPDRRGPGAGRPAKRYRRSGRALSVSVPERRYDIAAQVMARAITEASRSATPIAGAVHDAAVGAGQELGRLVSTRLGRRRSRAARNRAISEVLAQYGYEPRRRDGGVELANCPFHVLAEQHADLVCGMNLDLIDGMLQACELHGVRATLDPAPDRCCVTISSEQDA